MGSDASHLHPLLQETLRTGKIPPHEEIARAIGIATAEVARAVAAAGDSDSDDADNDVDAPSQMTRDSATSIGNSLTRRSMPGMRTMGKSPGVVGFRS